MRKKRCGIVFVASIVLGQAIINNPGHVYAAAVSPVQSEIIQENSVESSITEESNTTDVATTPETPQPITPTLPPIVPVTPDITLPPVTIEEPVPITPTVPIMPDNTLPSVPIDEPVPITPTAPPIVPEQPDNSLPSISLTVPEVEAEKSQEFNNSEVNSQDKDTRTEGMGRQVSENKDVAAQGSAKEELPQSFNTGWKTEASHHEPLHTTNHSLKQAEEDHVSRKHAIAVHAAGTGGVVTGVGTSVLLLSILKKASWLKQFFGK